ncbi:MAG: hypothetical protein ACE5RF_02810 [Nitrosarchaeum sp.]
MSRKVSYVEITFPDNIYAELELLQKALSLKDGKSWSISDTVNLLLRFSLSEKNDPIYEKNLLFLFDYLYTKEHFLNDFLLTVLMSAH